MVNLLKKGKEKREKVTGFIKEKYTIFNTSENGRKFKKELRRLLPFLAIAGFILIPDRGSLSVVLLAVGIVCIAIVVSHITRKLLFPNLDLQVVIDRADESPVASAMIVLGLIYLVVNILNSIVTLLR